jgi:periplasmic divalent cation tolerance protein
MTEMMVALSTCGSEQEARKLARELVEARLAACVNIVPGVSSVYRWQGKIEEDAEWLLLIKTRREHLDRLRAQLEESHSYDVPELIALSIEEGARPYLEWLEQQLRT